jgi:plasmid stabilization system protein ParE
MGNYNIFWTTQAKDDLKNIYDHWKKKSVQGAKNVRSDISEKSQNNILRQTVSN